MRRLRKGPKWKKDQEKSPEKELNKMEASKPPDTESKMMVVRMLKELSENVDEIKKDTWNSYNIVLNLNCAQFKNKKEKNLS